MPSPTAFSATILRWIASSVASSAGAGISSASSDRRSRLLFPTPQAEALKSSKAEIEAGFYEYLTSALTAEEAATFGAMLDKLYAASKAESRAGFPHFIHR